MHKRLQKQRVDLPCVLYLSKQLNNKISNVFIVFVNDPRAFSGDYIRFLENKLREFLPFHEVPIRLEFARKNPRKDKVRRR